MRGCLHHPNLTDRVQGRVGNTPHREHGTQPKAVIDDCHAGRHANGEDDREQSGNAEWAAVCPFPAQPAYLARRGTLHSIAALLAHDAVTFGRADGSANPWLIARGTGPIERCTVEGRMTVGLGDALVEAVIGGGGIAQLATWLVTEHLASGRLVQLLPGCIVGGLPLHLVWPRSRQLLPKVNALLTYLSATLDIT
jgi:DNA-binding transcriptional LysR family regulator